MFWFEMTPATALWSDSRSKHVWMAKLFRVIPFVMKKFNKSSVGLTCVGQ